MDCVRSKLERPRVEPIRHLLQCILGCAEDWGLVVPQQAGQTWKPSYWIQLSQGNKVL